MKIGREFAMPNKKTFSIPPIERFLRRHLLEGWTVVDPFAGGTSWATHTNDLNPAFEQTGMDAEQYLDMLIVDGLRADAVILDPPYSPRQISECYESVGRSVGMKDTQNARLYKACKDRMTCLLKPNGVALSFGWNSMGFGLTRGFDMVEILLVPHGAAHNNTICVAEVKRP